MCNIEVERFEPELNAPIFLVGGESLGMKSSELLHSLGELPERSRIKAVVYSYTQEYYEGSGDMAVILVGDFGRSFSVWTKDLGHCSCYGPLQDGFNYTGNWTTHTEAEYRKLGVNADPSTGLVMEEEEDPLYDTVIAILDRKKVCNVQVL